MKKLIIMSLAVFTIALVSCKSDQQKCEDEGKIWIAEGERCISPEQKDCEDKDDKTWNAEENKCEDKSNEQADCEAQEGKKWENDKCVDKEYTVLFESTEPGSEGHVASIATTSSDTKSLSETGKCAKVTASQLKMLTISVGAVGSQTILCDSDDKTTGVSPCSPGNYTIWYNPRTSGPGRLLLAIV